jgi:hypothetical protein
MQVLMVVAPAAPKRLPYWCLLPQQGARGRSAAPLDGAGSFAAITPRGSGSCGAGSRGFNSLPPLLPLPLIGIGDWVAGTVTAGEYRCRSMHWGDPAPSVRISVRLGRMGE